MKSNHKKFATKTMPKKHFKKILLFFKNLIIGTDYRDGRQKIDIVHGVSKLDPLQLNVFICIFQIFFSYGR